MRKKELRVYKGKGNRHNRFKRDTKRLEEIEKNGKPAGYLGLRWEKE